MVHITLVKEKFRTTSIGLFDEVKVRIMWVVNGFDQIKLGLTYMLSVAWFDN